MNSPAHILINSAIGKKLEERGVKPIYHALIIGSVFPDIPLTVLSIAFIGWHAFGGGAMSGGEAAQIAFDDYYFNKPSWIAAHNAFHAPLMNVFWLAIGYWLGFKQNQRWARWFFWFAVGTSLHSLLDIPTHHDDGPLLLFPFNWDVRFISAVSYWDPDHYGLQFAAFENLINILLGIYFFKEWRRKRARRAAAASQENVVSAAG